MAGKLRAILGILFSATLLGSAACAGDTGPEGPKGPKGDPGSDGSNGGGDTGGGSSVSETISAVTPSSAFIARTIDVVVSGDNTTWDSSTKVDFGSSVKVNKITVGSPTAILANITVADDADEGAIDIKVGEDTYKGTFSLKSPVALGDSAGKADQGGLVLYPAARGLDFTTPFDTTSTGDGFFTPLVYTNLAADGATALILNASDYTLGFAALIDVNAAAGPSPLTILSGPAGGDITKFPSPKALNVTARTPKPISAAAQASFTPSAPLATGLFVYTPADASGRIVTVTPGSDDAAAGPAVFVLDKSGKFSTAIASLVSQAQFISSSTDKFFIVALDSQGGASPVTVDITEDPVTIVHDTEPNENSTQAVAVASTPAVVIDGKLASETDVDWYKLTLDATAIGKTINVSTVSPADSTDSLIDIFAGDGTTSLGESDDQDYDETLSSSIITGPGTYYVKISASHAGFFDPASNTYQAFISVE